MSFQVLLSGCTIKQFILKRDLSHGDPLSHYLFILCQDILSWILLKDELEGKIHGVKLSKSGTPISHLMFANDIVLFMRASLVKAQHLWEGLHKFEVWSSQKINIQKYMLSFSWNTLRQLKENNRNFMQMNYL